MDHKLYLSDKGIFKKQNNFYYHRNLKKVTDQPTLERLKSLYVPPAWTSVWYASNKNCHVQVRGVDVSGKKQYILSEKWVNNARYEKYKRMKRFVKDLKLFKRKIKLTTYNTSKEFLINFLFHLLIDLHIRVGNEIYAQTNQSYGLTTLRQKHLQGNKLCFLLKCFFRNNYIFIKKHLSGLRDNTSNHEKINKYIPKKFSYFQNKSAKNSESILKIEPCNFRVSFRRISPLKRR